MNLTDEQAKYAWKVALNISGKNGHSTLGRNRNVDARHRNLGKTFVGHTDDEIAELVTDKDQPSMSSLIVNVEFAREVLESLSPTDQQILVLHTAGHSTAEIAIQLDFANAQVVATKIGQIRTKLKKAFGSQI